MHTPVTTVPKHVTENRCWGEAKYSKQLSSKIPYSETPLFLPCPTQVPLLCPLLCEPLPSLACSQRAPRPRSHPTTDKADRTHTAATATPCFSQVCGSAACCNAHCSSCGAVAAVVREKECYARSRCARRRAIQMAAAGGEKPGRKLMVGVMGYA